MKAYEDYAQSGMFWHKSFPTHWKKEKISQLFSQVKNKNIGMVERNLLSLSYGMVKRRNISATEGLLPESFEGYNIIEADDIVLRLTDLQNDKRSLRTGLAKERGIITSAYVTIRNKSNNSPQYMQLFLHTFDLAKGFYNVGAAGVRQGLSWDDIKKFEIAIPPRSEQDQIVRYLDWQVSKINKLIAAKRKEIELLKLYKKASISYLITHGFSKSPMKRSEIYWLNSIPADWSVTKLKYILKKEYRNVPDGAELLVCSNNGEVKLRGDNKLGLVAASNDIYQGVAKGDLLIHGMDTWHGAIAISEYDGMCTPVVHVCTCNQSKRFVAYYLKMMAYTKVFKAISNGVRQNTSDFRSWKTFGNLLIAFPNIKEQEYISDELDQVVQSVGEAVEKYEQQIEVLHDLRNRLISDVVTGQIDVRNIEVPDFEYVEDIEDTSDEDEGLDEMSEDKEA